MSPVEAVARALDSGAWMPSYVGDGTRRDMALVKARNAIMALRDNGVTEGMREAYLDADSFNDGFRAMLDSALEDG